MASIEITAKVRYIVPISNYDYNKYLDGKLDEEDLVDEYYDELIVDNEVDFEVTDSTVYDSI